MKFIFFGDFFKVLYKIILTIIILVLIVPKISFLFSSTLDYEGRVSSTYVVATKEKEEEKEEEKSKLSKMWINIKEFYISGF